MLPRVRMPPYRGCSSEALGVGAGAVGFGVRVPGPDVTEGPAAGVQLAGNTLSTVKQSAVMKILLACILDLLLPMLTGKRTRRPTEYSVFSLPLLRAVGLCGLPDLPAQAPRRLRACPWSARSAALLLPPLGSLPWHPVVGHSHQPCTPAVRFP